MLRALFVALFVLIDTMILAPIVIIAALLKIRGGVYMWVTRTWSQLFLWACGVRVAVEGLEHVSGGEPRVIVSNHLSWIDIVAIAVSLAIAAETTD